MPVLLTVLVISAAKGSLEGDEAFYAGVALESLSTDRIYPLLVNGEPYIHKPPLVIWMQGISMALLGPSTISARLPGVLFGALVLIVVVLFAARRWGQAVGVASGILLLSIPTVLGTKGHHGLSSGTADSLLLLTILLCLVATLRWLEVGSGSCLILACTAAAVSAWSKGAVGPAFLSLAIPLLVFTRRTMPRTEGPGLRPLVMVLIVVLSSWAAFLLWLLTLKLAGVPRIAARLIDRNIVQRLTAGLNEAHVQGPWFYFETLLEDFGLSLVLLLMSLLLFLFGAHREPPARPLLGFLWIVSATWIGVLSVSVSKLPWYSLPVLPPLCWLAAWTLLGIRTIPLRRAGASVASLIALVLIGVPAARAIRELATPPVLHSTDLALRALTARGERLAAVDPSLRFGRFGQLDATEYFLARAATWRLSHRPADAEVSDCPIHLEPRRDDEPADSRHESTNILWSSVTKPNGWRLVLARRCAPQVGWDPRGAITISSAIARLGMWPADSVGAQARIAAGSQSHWRMESGDDKAAHSAQPRRSI